MCDTLRFLELRALYSCPFFVCRSVRWEHLIVTCCVSNFGRCTGTNEVGAATDTVTFYQSHEEISQVSLWNCIQGDRIDHATHERGKSLASLGNHS